MPKQTGNSPRILIVDDTLENIQVLDIILKHHGYDTDVARNGLQALALVQQNKPDLILLDIMMPEMDGYETCQCLKSDPAGKDIPVIFLTALEDTDNIVKGFEAGAVDYVTKPFTSAELLARVRTQLELTRNRETIRRISQERAELLHILCHDLANPMNAIISVLNVAKSREMLERMQSFLLSAANNGLEIIGMVRKMRALEEKGLRLGAVNFNQALLVSREMLASKFEAKQIRWREELAEDFDINAEKISLINSVLNNLLTNAVKFSHPGGEVFISTCRDKDGMLLQIRDHGIGMPAQLLKDIFNIAKTTSREGTAGEEGTGFGMPLVKKFVQAYGGKIEITSAEAEESADDHGTTIRVYLPLAHKTG